MATRSPTLAPYVLTRIASTLTGLDIPLVWCRDLLRARGLPLRHAEALQAEARRLYQAKWAADYHRRARRLGYCPVTVNAHGRMPLDIRAGTDAGRVSCVSLRYPTWPSTRHAETLPTGSLSDRLQAARLRAVDGAYRASVRVGANDRVQVTLTTDPAAIGVHQVAGVDRTVYRGSFKGWACHYRTHTVTVPTDWRIRVQRRGLAELDGLMTIDAAPLEGAPEGVDLYAAAWIEQGRGNACSVVRGYIARDAARGLSYHARTAADALAGLRRKVRGADWMATLQTADLSTLIRGHESLPVRVTDARAIGACEYGIRSWCRAVSLPYEAGSAPLADVARAYATEPRPEARAAILHALRRARALRMAA